MKDKVANRFFGLASGKSEGNMSGPPAAVTRPGRRPRNITPRLGVRITGEEASASHIATPDAFVLPHRPQDPSTAAGAVG